MAGLLFLLAVAATFALGLMAVSIFQRREEARPRPPLAPIGDMGNGQLANGALNYPREYDSYKLMADTPRGPNTAAAMPRDYLEETPANVILFAGYAFAKDYHQARGHTSIRVGRTQDASRDREDAGHLLDLQEPRRAAADARDGRSGEVLRRQVRST